MSGKITITLDENEVADLYFALLTCQHRSAVQLRDQLKAAAPELIAQKKAGRWRPSKKETPKAPEKP